MQNNLFLKIAWIILKVTLVVIFLILALAMYAFLMYKSKGPDLVQSETWAHFPGATMTPNGIHFQPLNRIIVHQDGSIGQPNPPVNINGKHLLVSGDFSITATLLQIDKQASFRLYAAPPIIYDQWRYESPSINIDVDAVQNLITARIWDGSSCNSIDMRSYQVYVPFQTVVSLEHINDQINIIADGKVLGVMPDHHIFDSGAVWFGADGVAKSNGWTLNALNAKAIETGYVKVLSAPLLVATSSDPNGLGKLASARSFKIKIGTAVNADVLFTDEQYKDLTLNQFSIWTPENSMKPEFIHPGPDVYDFAQADQLVDAALKNNIMVHGHALVYDKSTPEWMVKSPKENLQEIMVSHIENVVTHFKGRVAEWDVVNEPFSKKNVLYKNGKTGLEPNLWFEAMGEEYIDLAFKAARQADPTATLYLNEYGVENDGQRWDALLGLVKRLKQRNVPIDGIGFESHIYSDGDYIHTEEFKKHIKSLDALGLLVRVSEIDVTGDDSKEQINQYVAALDVCLRAPNCTSYTTWGITDRYGSTTRPDRYPLVYGTSLLWDKEIKSKLPYDALQKRLQQPD